MKRRDFFKLLGALAASPALAKVEVEEPVKRTLSPEVTEAIYSEPVSVNTELWIEVVTGGGIYEQFSPVYDISLRYGSDLVYNQDMIGPALETLSPDNHTIAVSVPFSGNVGLTGIERNMMLRLMNNGQVVTEPQFIGTVIEETIVHQGNKPATAEYIIDVGEIK